MHIKDLKPLVQKINSKKASFNEMKSLLEFYESFIEYKLSTFKEEDFLMGKDDVRQEVKIKIFSNLLDMDMSMSPEEIDYWFKKIISNKIIGEYRKNKEREIKKINIDEPIGGDSSDDERKYQEIIPSLERDITEIFQETELINKLYNKVSDDSKKIITLILEGKNKREIKENMGMSKKTILRRINREIIPALKELGIEK